MITQKINENDVKSLRISSLPTRPTTPSALGGKGYSPKDMKEAFDKLSLHIIEHFNSLIDDIKADPESSVSATMKTGIRENHTLSKLFGDITSGELAGYMTVFGESLVSYLGKMREDIDRLKSEVKK